MKHWGAGWAVVFLWLGCSAGMLGSATVALAQSCVEEKEPGECLLRLQPGELGRLLDEQPEGRWEETLEDWYRELGLDLPLPLVGDPPLEVVSVKRDLLLLRSDAEKDCRQTLLELERVGPDKPLRHVEYNYVYRALVEPNDPWYRHQWGLKNEGQGTKDCGKGRRDVDVRAEEAWDVWDASPQTQVVVAVVDSGIDYEHPDLADNIWENEDEAQGVPGKDDEGNRLVDDVRGWDFDRGGPTPLDATSHGTHIAGTIGARWNNNGNVGVAGIARNVRLIPLRFLNASNRGNLCNAIRAIEYAIDKEVPIVNLSWASCAHSEELRRVLADAQAARDGAGILFVAAAGNDQRDNDRDPLYPAAYDLDNILSVTSIDHHGELCHAWGGETVDVAAPGKCIAGLSGQHRDQLLWLGGTSMATAHVSGIAALVLSAHPGLSARELKERILDSATRLVSNHASRPTVTGGYVDAFEAIR